MPIHCEIISQDRIVFRGEVDIVVLPGVEGEMGVLPNHAPILTVLKYGVITVRSEGEEDYFTVAGGVAEVKQNQVIILADAAENVVEIDFQRAEAARKRAEEVLKVGPEQDQDSYLKIQAALRRSNLRIDAFSRYQKGKNLRNRG
jgi:F-type H+-transporting ATPase subunit epsilon